MNWFQFIASLVSSLAWPLVILGIVALLRDPLSRLLRSLHHFAMQGVEFDFGQQLASIEREADQAKIPDTAVEPTLGMGGPASSETPAETSKEDKWDIDDDVRALAAQSPDSAVIRAWIEIERTVQDAMARLGYGRDARRIPRADIRMLHEEHYIDDETYRILVRLSMLRNQAVHPQGTSAITYAEALEYAHLAKRMAKRLNGIELR